MNSSANSRDTVSAGKAPTSADSVKSSNVSYHSGSAAPLPASSFTSFPAMHWQLFKGNQMINNHIDPNLKLTLPEQPPSLQSFFGKQECKEPIINANASGSRPPSPDPNVQTTKEDLGDGFRRITISFLDDEGNQITVRIQYFEADWQVFRDDVKNANTLNSKDSHHNLAPDVLQSGFENDNTVELNNDNDSSETTGVIMRGTSIRVNGVGVTGSTPGQSANPTRSWTDRLFRRNLLQRFQGKQKFMGSVKDKKHGQLE